MFNVRDFTFWYFNFFEKCSFFFQVGFKYNDYSFRLTAFFPIQANNLFIHTNIKPHVTLGRYVFILDSKFYLKFWEVSMVLLLKLLIS